MHLLRALLATADREAGVWSHRHKAQTQNATVILTAPFALVFFFWDFFFGPWLEKGS